MESGARHRPSFQDACALFAASPTSNMAREFALGCHDILAMIFDHLVPATSDGHEATEKSRRTSRMTLASSARVCTTLSHHALNALWRELDSIHPLLKALPNCALVEGQVMFCGAISDKYWSRFQLYAGRVRAIEGPLEPEPLDPIHPSIWVFLAARCRGSPLMPHLRHLFVFDLRIPETSGLTLLLSPSLRSLNIFFALQLEKEEDSQIVSRVATTLLETLPLMAPNLESLHYTLDIDLDKGEDIIESLTQFTRLQTLSIGPKLALREYALERLSSIATLRGLSCSIDILDGSGLHPFIFQGLTCLHLTGSLDDLTAFLDACQLPNLASIHLEIKEPPRVREPADSLAAICRRRNPALLTSFRADILYDDESALPSPPICLVQYFESLLSFPNIETFHVSSSRMLLSIHDDHLVRFGAAWPRLSRFYISQWQRTTPSEVPRPTLSGLFELARRCPHLDIFRVPVLDASVIPEKNEALPLGHHLRVFSGDDTTVPSPGSPAYLEALTLFGKVFPSIVLEYSQSLAKPNAKKWKKFLGDLETVRR